MATTDLPVSGRDRDESIRTGGPPRSAGGISAWAVAKAVLTPLASLKLTVVLLGMAVFVVLAGTLAQAEIGIERVVNEFFRVRPWGSTLGFAWIPLQVFFPESFFPNPVMDRRPVLPGGFWFPGGWLIGLAMFANLLAAHAVRFTFQAKGRRLWAGLGVILLGGLVTAAVIGSGSGAGGLQAAPVLSWTVLWRLFQVAVVLLAFANVGLAIRLHARATTDRRAAWLATAAAPLAVALGGWALLIPDVGESSMRILWQLIKATMAASVLLAGCRLVFQKRAGIVLLHAGVAMLMVSELLVGLLAVETSLTLREGETRSWAEDVRRAELVVIDPSSPEHDVVTRFPAAMLKPGATLAHASIPVTIRVDEYFSNSDVKPVAAGKPNQVDAGLGRSLLATEAAETPGTSAAVDFPSAYVTVTAKDGQPLGRYLLTTFQASDQIRASLARQFSVAVEPTELVTVDGKPMKLALRFKRDYKPYSVSLVDVRKDDYVGTDVPKNYSSDVRVTSQTLGADFPRRIWMNNPLRFAGETLYQADYLFPNSDPQRREGTRLQVVRNTGWMLPYVSCMIVVVGAAAQFLGTLWRFLGRRAEAQAAAVRAGEPVRARGRRLGWVLPAAAVLVFGAWLGSKALPPRTPAGQPDLAAFGKIPVVANGRYKPIDTVARDAMKTVADNRQTFLIDGERQPATRWLIDFIADPKKGLAHRVVRVDDSELIAVLALPANRDDFRYSVQEVIDALPKLETRLKEIRDRQSRGEVLRASDRGAIELQGKLGTIDLLLQSFRPNFDALRDGVSGLQRQLGIYQALKKGIPGTDTRGRNPPLAVYYTSPPQVAARNGDPETQWETLAYAELMEGLQQLAAPQGGATHQLQPAVAAWSQILDAWKTGDATAFNANVSKYRTSLAEKPPEGYEPAPVEFEARFNQAEPFYYLIFPYAFAALLGACSWFGLSRPLNRTAFWLAAGAFVLHTLALAGRIYISGRPPITNLYSSAVFVGWGAVAFGIGLEAVYRLGFGNVLAGVTGAVTLLIAHGLAGDGEDTFSVLQAVLDTQFWLATHVVTINLGYSAVAAAGCLGLFYVLLGLTTPLLGERVGVGPRAQTVGDAVTRMTYGLLCFAMLFSFFGTVLGGLWADDSWGRFWGWDPKENGALIIVLWTALVLHARWGGIVKDRGLAVLAIGGNIAVSWSWFGTNQLGVGLHAYGGFAGTVVFALSLFILSQVAVIAAGCLPKSLWRSFRPTVA